MVGETSRSKPLDTLANLVSPGADGTELSTILNNALSGIETKETKTLSDLIFPGASSAALSAAMVEINSGTSNNAGRRLSDLISPGASSTALATILSIGPQLGPIPILLEAFESTTGFTGGSNQTSTLRTDNPVQGSGYLNSAAIAVGSGQGICNFKTKATQMDPAAEWGNHVALAYKQDPFATNSVSVEFARSSSVFTNFNDATVNADNRVRGWKWNSQALTGLISGVGSVQIRPRYQTRNPSNADVSYDALIVGQKPKGRVSIDFDDCYMSQYTLAFPYMQALNLRGNINVVRESTESGINWRLSPVECQIMYDAGWDMCLNTGNDFSIDWAGFGGNPAGAVAEFQAAQAYNLSHGWVRGSDCLVYSNGIFQTDPVVCHATAITAAGGSNDLTVTTISGSQIPVIGMVMTSFQLNGAVITNVVGSSAPFTVTMDQTVPSTVTRAVFYDDSGNFTPKGKIQTPAPGPLALQNAGFKHGRTTNGGGMYIECGFGDQALQANGQGATGATAAQLIGYIDTAIAAGQWLNFYFHSPDGPLGTDIPMSVLTPVLDYIALKRDQGVLEVPTKSEAVAIAEAGKTRLATLVAVS